MKLDNFPIFFSINVKLKLSQGNYLVLLKQEKLNINI